MRLARLRVVGAALLALGPGSAPLAAQDTLPAAPAGVPVLAVIDSAATLLAGCPPRYLEGENGVEAWNLISGMILFLILDGLCERVDAQQALDGFLLPEGRMMGGLARFGRLAM
jgi:hypothetical protein